jgi:hypothetical protein
MSAVKSENNSAALRSAFLSWDWPGEFTEGRSVKGMELRLACLTFLISLLFLDCKVFSIQSFLQFLYLKVKFPGKNLAAAHHSNVPVSKNIFIMQGH